MKFIDRIKATKVGLSKARRDVSWARDFMKEHEGNPPVKIAKKFFDALGEDVDRENEFETVGYAEGIKGFQEKLIKEFSSRHDREQDQISKVVVLAESSPQVMELIKSTGMDTEMLDRISADHGHDSLEEECAALQALRAIIADRD
jgi:hypothetical protein